MRYLFFFCAFIFSCVMKAQRCEYVYNNKADSSYNCYLKVFPVNDTIKGLIIRDFSWLPDTAVKPIYKFGKMCSDAGYMIVYTVSSKFSPELFVSDSVMAVLDNMIGDVLAEHSIPKQNIFIGGISASGTRALRYAQYCEQGKSKHHIRIRGVFSVDPPLDLARFYQSAYTHKSNFKAGMLSEANYMLDKVFPVLFSGPPHMYRDEYAAASVFSPDDSVGGNARCLKNMDIILYHEPDIDWWLYERGATYYDMNSYDISGFVLKLTQMGNRNVKLVTTTGKGFDSKGNRNCHSWSIVNETELLHWIEDRSKQR